MLLFDKQKYLLALLFSVFIASCSFEPAWIAEDNKTKNRDEFNEYENKYLDKYPMTSDQRKAVIDRNWNLLLELGGNIYYTSKLAANDGINFQNLAGRMTGMGVEAYREMMISGGRSIEGNRTKSEWEKD